MRECRVDVRGIGKPGSHFWSNKSDIVSCSFKQAWRSWIVLLDMAPFECLPSLHTLNNVSWSTNNCSQGFCFKAMIAPPPPTTIAHNAKISCYSVVKILRSLYVSGKLLILTFTFTRDLSCIASILFTQVKVMGVRTEKLRDSGNSLWEKGRLPLV